MKKARNILNEFEFDLKKLPEEYLLRGEGEDLTRRPNQYLCKVRLQPKGMGFN